MILGHLGEGPEVDHLVEDTSPAHVTAAAPEAENGADHHEREADHQKDAQEPVPDLKNAQKADPPQKDVKKKKVEVALDEEALSPDPTGKILFFLPTVFIH